MSAPNREVFENSATTTLNGGIDDTQTSITVTDGSVFPSTGNFRLLIGSEIMHVTARSSNTLTVNRGVEGTSAAAHSDLAPARHIITQDGLLRAAQDNSVLWGSSGPLALHKIVDASGNVIDSSYFTIINQSSTVFTDLDGTIGIRKPANAGGDSNTFMAESVSPPFTRIIAFQSRGGRTQTLEHTVCGLAMRDSATNRLIVFCKDYNHGLKIGCYRYTALNTFNSFGFTTQTVDLPEIVWLKIEVDATNAIFSFSPDGVNWYVKLTESKSAFLANIDQVGPVVNQTQSNDPLLARIFHYSAG